MKGDVRRSTNKERTVDGFARSRLSFLPVVSVTSGCIEQHVKKHICYMSLLKT